MNLDSTARLLDEWRDAAPSYHGTNYGAAINWARDLAIRESAAEEELHIYTDLQRSGLDWAEVDPLPENVKVHLHDVGRSVVSNLGVTEARPIRGVVRPGEGTTVQTTILNSTPFPVAEQQVILKLESPRGKLSLRERVKLEPGSTGSVKFEVPPLEEGLWTGAVSINADDDLKFDNARQVAILASKANRILLADGDPARSPLLSETYFLATALRLAPSGEAYSETPFDPVIVPLEPGDSLPPLRDVKVVVLANVGEVTNETARGLSGFVHGGGGLVVFGGDRVQAKGYAPLATAGLVPGRIAGPVHASDLPFRLDSWEEQHPVLKPFADPQHGDLHRLWFRGYTKLLVNALEGLSAAGRSSSTSAATSSTPPANDEPKILARFRNGDPVLIEQSVGSGKVVWFTSSCDRGWGEWPSSNLYLPLVHQIVGEPLGLNEGGPVRTILIDAASPPVATPEVKAHTGYAQVINSSPRESETERCTRNEFAERFQLVLQDRPGEPVVQPAAAASVAGADLRKDERWHWAAVALVALMLLESFVGNRTVS